MRKVGHRQSIYAAASSNNFLIGQDMILVHVLLASLEAAAAAAAGGGGHTKGLFASLATSIATAQNFERPDTASQEDTVDLTFNA